MQKSVKSIDEARKTYLADQSGPGRVVVGTFWICGEAASGLQWVLSTSVRAQGTFRRR